MQALPSPRTLPGILKGIDVQPGWHETVPMAPRKKAEGLSALNRQVTLCFDEVSLKENVAYDVTKDQVEGLDQNSEVVNHAGVFMIQSVVEK